MASRVRINEAKTRAAVFAMSQEAVIRGANRYRERVREEILLAGRVDTGEMHTRIEVRPQPPRGGAEARASVTPQTEHFIYQDQGTRDHVVRAGGKTMAWKVKGTGVFVFARKRRGVKAGEFLRKARLKMKITDFA